MRRFATIVFATTLLSLFPASAFAGGAASQAQGTISNQIDAFLNDDMQKAYSYASPGIKRMYPTPGLFFDMVRKGYAPVYRPGNYAFGRSRVSPDGNEVVQEVLIHAPDGHDWTAIYTLARQADGSLKITSVHMVRSAPPSA